MCEGEVTDDRGEGLREGGRKGEMDEADDEREREREREEGRGGVVGTRLYLVHV